MRRRRFASAVALAVFATSAGFATADTLYWNGGNFDFGSYNWTDFQDTSNAFHVPQPADTANIGGGTAYFPAGQTFTVAAVNLDGNGGLGGPGTLVVAGTFSQASSGSMGINLVVKGNGTWSGGNWNTVDVASTTVTTSGALTISPGAGDIAGRTIANYGLVSHQSSAIQGGGNTSASVIENFGTWSEDSTVYNTQFNSALGGAGLTFNNRAGGVLQKTTANSTTLYVPFNNAGAVDTQAGPLYVSGGGTASDGASFAAAADAGNYFNSYYTLDGTVSFSGAGTNALTSGGAMAGNWALSGSLTWNGGQFNTHDATTVLPGSSLLIAGPGDNDMPNHTFVNGGTVTLQVGRLRGGGGYGSSFVNEGLFVDATTSDTQLNNDYGGPGLSFTNGFTGTFRKTGSTSTNVIATMVNDGLIDVRAGTMYLQSGSSNPGSSFDTGASAVVSFCGFNLASGVNYGGAGLYQVGSGVNTFAGVVDAQRFEFAGGSSQFADVTFTGAGVTWSGGNWIYGGTVTLAPTGRLAITTAQADLPSTSLANRGTVTWNGSGTIRGGAGGTLIVNAGAWVDSNAASGVYNADYGGNGMAFSNAATGVYRKVGAGATLFNNVPFYNDGLLDVQAGTLTLVGGTSAASSSLSVAANAALSLNSYAIAADVNYGGQGTYQLAGGFNSLAGTVNARQLNVAGGLAVLNGVTFSNSTVTWTGGAFSQGAGTIAATSELVIASSPSDLPNTALLNLGTIVRSAAVSVRGGGSGSAIVNGALWLDSAPGDVTLNSDYGGGGLTFTNAVGATLRKTTGFAVSFSGVPLYQSGTLDARAGGFYIYGGGRATDGATFNAAAGATVSFGGNYELDGTIHMTGAGSVVLSGGNLSGTQVIDGTFRWDGGNLNSPGTTGIRAGSTMVVSSAPADLAGREIDILGTFVHAAGNLRGGGAGSVISNNGLFLETSPADDQINGDYSGNGLTLDNFTTFRKTSASTLNISNVTFANSGLFDLQAGTVYFSGSLVARDGSTISAAANTYDAMISPNLSGTVAFSGSGKHQLIGGTLSGTHVIVGNFEWAGGNLNSPGATTIPAGSSFLVDSSPADLAGRTIELSGTFTHALGNLRGGGGGGGSVLDNRGLFLETSAADDQINGDYQGNGFTFNNYTTFRKTGSAVTNVTNIAFNNQGLVDVQSGTLYFSSSLVAADGSTVNAGAGTAVYLNGPSLSGTVTFSGSGTRQFYAGTLNGNHVVHGRLDWAGGNLNTTGYTELAPDAAMEISSAPADMIGHTFVNRGAVTQDANTIRGGGPGSLIVNYGSWTESGDGVRQVNGDFQGNGLTFSNAAGGTLSLASATTGLTLSGITFSNAGTLQVGAGSLTVNSSAFSQTAGVTHLGGGTIGGNSLLQYSDSSISGTGTLSAPVIASYVTIAPDAPAGHLAFANLQVAAPVVIPARNPVATAPSLTILNSISFAGTGVLDLSDNDLLLRGPAEASVQSMVVLGQIFSAYGNPYAGVGVITNTDGRGGALHPTYDGQPATSTDVLVKYTYLGDTDLNGTVDANDLANYFAGVSGGLTGWLNGDFNYDGQVNAADLALLLASLQHQTVSFGASGGPAGAVPEPASLALALPALALVGRRRR